MTALVDTGCTYSIVLNRSLTGDLKKYSGHLQLRIMNGKQMFLRHFVYCSDIKLLDSVAIPPLKL